MVALTECYLMMHYLLGFILSGRGHVKEMMML